MCGAALRISPLNPETAIDGFVVRLSD